MTTTIQCAGNRRNEYTRNVKQVRGVGWEGGAISTGVFGGARLRDVLLFAGVNEEDHHLHVSFEGADDCIESKDGGFLIEKYGSSIPLFKAMNPYGDVLLAYDVRGSFLVSFER